MDSSPNLPEDTQELVEVLNQAKPLAARYYQLTDRALGITGEVAEAEAARLLNLTLCPPRSPYDATRDVNGETQRLEIKGRCLLPGAKSGQRLGRMNLKTDWDFALMVLLDEHFEATGIWEASRRKLEQALNEPGSRARNERRQLSVTKFKKIGDQIWAPADSRST